MAGMQVLGTSYGLSMYLSLLALFAVEGRKEEMESACLSRQQNQNEKIIP